MLHNTSPSIFVRFTNIVVNITKYRDNTIGKVVSSVYDFQKSSRRLKSKKKDSGGGGGDDDVDEEDNYPVEYKQLRKAGNGPKEILVTF